MNSEPSINVLLGQAFNGKHPRWTVVAEASQVLQNRSRRPDILIDQSGAAPVVVETEFPPGRGVEKDALARLGRRLGSDGSEVENVLAVMLHPALRDGQEDLGARVAASKFAYAVFGGSAQAPVRWPRNGWLEGGIDELASAIEHAGVSERQVARGTEIVERVVRQAANFATKECAGGVSLDRVAAELCQAPGLQTTRMAMAILGNAVTFHRSIAEHPGVPELSPSRERFPLRYEVTECWQTILDEINYWPIFDIALRLFRLIKPRVAIQLVDRMERMAEELDGIGVLGMQDISGQMFQRLITDRKFLATFYTLPSSSALLATLGVGRMDVDWSDSGAVTDLRIADLACGTGTLLSAAYRAIQSRFRWAGGDDEAIHSAAMERVLVGADIMPAATHLTASMLSSAHPGVPFAGTRIMTCPYGEQPEESGRPLALGSLDLIEGETAVSVLGIRPAQEVQADIFGTGREELHGRGESRADDGTQVALPHGTGDLLIMNPPFTRPTNHEVADVPVPAFAGFATSEEEQRAMSAELKRIRKKLKGPAGHGNAGLASNFIDLAHVKTRPGGVVALVLPASFVSGSSWQGARSMFERRYRDVTVVSMASAGQTDRAFSADTGMAEVLVVATKREEEQPGEEGAPAEDTLFVNLYSRPRTPGEGVVVGEAIRALPDTDNPGWIRLGKDAIGSFMREPLAEGGCAGLCDPVIARSMLGLRGGSLHVPRDFRPLSLPMVRLGELGRKGRLHRDINGRHPDGSPRGPFDIVAAGPQPEYPALWSHKAERERTIAMVREAEGVVREGMGPRAASLWKNQTSRLHFTQDFQINSQSLAACMTEHRTIGGRAWPNFIVTDSRWEVPIALWANTTLGLMTFWWIGTRQQQGRAVLTLSRLPDLPVFDPRALSSEQMARAEALYQQVRDVPLLPANEAYRDDARKELDREALVGVFGMPDEMLDGFSVLRDKWCFEPSVHGGKDTRPRAPLLDGR